MTDEELKELVASLAISQRETGRQIQALRESQKETDRQLQETDRQLQATNRQLQETDRQLQETDRQLQATDRQLRRQLKELGKQIGGLGEKFGGFTEGMAWPSMKRLLMDELGMEFVTPRVKVRKNGETLELDAFAYANGEKNAAYVVEVKSHLRQEGIEQLKTIMPRVRRFFSEHRYKKLYGVLAVVDAPEDLRQQALDEGFLMAGIHDDLFVMESPDDFVPKNW